MKIAKKILIVALLANAFVASAANYVIGTGSQSGTYYPFGGALAKVWGENIKDFNMNVEVTAASVENTIKVNKGAQLVGIAMGDTVISAYDGKKPFPQKQDINVLFALYPNLVQIVVPANSSIKTIADLKGKKVSLGAAGSGTRVGAISILGALGIDAKKDIDAQSLNYTATTSALANGQIDAGFIIASLGVGAITELALTHDVRILSFTPAEIKTISEKLPAYSGISAPANAYNKMPAFTVPAVWNVLVVNKNIDEKLAYEMTKVAYEHMAEVQKIVIDAKFTTPENAHKLAGVPLNKGSEKYLKEIGKL